MNAVFARTGGNHSRWFKMLSAIALLLMLAGCGFHLQGTYQPPAGVDSVYVAYSNAYKPGEPPLVDILQQRLRMLGVLGGPDADAKLIIHRVSNRRTGVSRSVIDDDVVEYRLHSSVLFDYIVNGRALLKGEQFAVTRYYSYDEETRLASEKERRQIEDTMQGQLVDRILFRIKHVTDEQELG